MSGRDYSTSSRGGDSRTRPSFRSTYRGRNYVPGFRGRSSRGRSFIRSRDRGHRERRRSSSSERRVSSRRSSRQRSHSRSASDVESRRSSVDREDRRRRSHRDDFVSNSSRSTARRLSTERRRHRSSSSLEDISSNYSTSRNYSPSPLGKSAQSPQPATTAASNSNDQHRLSASPSPKESLRITVDNDHFESRRHLWKPIGASAELPESPVVPLKSSSPLSDIDSSSLDDDLRSDPRSGGRIVIDREAPTFEHQIDQFDWPHPSEDIQNDIEYADAEMGRNRDRRDRRDSWGNNKDRGNWNSNGKDNRDRGRDKHVSSIVPRARDDEPVWKIRKVLNERDMDAFDDDVTCDRFAKRVENPDPVNLKPVKLEMKSEPRNIDYDMFDERVVAPVHQQPRGSTSFYEPAPPRSLINSGQLPGLGFDDLVQRRPPSPRQFQRMTERAVSPEHHPRTAGFTIPGLGDDMDVEDEDKFLYGDEAVEPDNVSRSRIPGLGIFSENTRPNVRNDPRTARDLGNIFNQLGFNNEDSRSGQTSIPKCTPQAIMNTITDLYQRLRDPSRSSQDPRLQARKETSESRSSADARMSSVREAESRSRKDSSSDYNRSSSLSRVPVDPRLNIRNRSESVDDQEYRSNQRDNQSKNQNQNDCSPMDPRITARETPPQMHRQPTSTPRAPVSDQQIHLETLSTQYSNYQQPYHNVNTAIPATSTIQTGYQYSDLNYGAIPNMLPLPTIKPPVPVPVPPPAPIPNYTVQSMYQTYPPPAPLMSTSIATPSNSNRGITRPSDYPSQSRPSNLKVIVPTSPAEVPGPPGVTVSSATTSMTKTTKPFPLVEDEMVRTPVSVEERNQLKIEFTQSKSKLDQLVVELERLRRAQGELMRKKQRQKDGHNDPQLLKNQQLQVAHERQISSVKRKTAAIEKALKASEAFRTSINLHTSVASPSVSRRVSSTEEKGRKNDGRKPEEAAKKASPPPKRFVFVDSSENWCKHCGELFKLATDLLRHLHSKHSGIMKNVSPCDRPWASKSKEPNASSAEFGEQQVVVFQGTEFMLPCEAFFCDLCKEFAGDVIAGRVHLESEKHNTNYQRYVRNNPGYPKRLNYERREVTARRREENKRRAETELRETLQAKKRREEAKLADKLKDKEKDVVLSDMEISDGEEQLLLDPVMMPGGSKPIRLNLLSNEKGDDSSTKPSKIAITLKKNKDSSKSTSVNSGESTKGNITTITISDTNERTQRILSNLYKSKKIKKDKVSDTQVQTQASIPITIHELETSTEQTYIQPPISGPISYLPHSVISLEEDLLPPGVDRPSPQRLPFNSSTPRPPPPLTTSSSKPNLGGKNKQNAETLLSSPERVKIKQEPKTPERKLSNKQESSREFGPQLPDDFCFDDNDLNQVMNAIPLPVGLDDMFGDDFLINTDKSTTSVDEDVSHEKFDSPQKDGNGLTQDEIVEGVADIVDAILVEIDEAIKKGVVDEKNILDEDCLDSEKIVKEIISKCANIDIILDAVQTNSDIESMIVNEVKVTIEEQHSVETPAIDEFNITEGESTNLQDSVILEKCEISEAVEVPVPEVGDHVSDNENSNPISIETRESIENNVVAEEQPSEPTTSDDLPFVADNASEFQDKTPAKIEEPIIDSGVVKESNDMEIDVKPSVELLDAAIAASSGNQVAKAQVARCSRGNRRGRPRGRGRGRGRGRVSKSPAVSMKIKEEPLSDDD